MASEEPEKKKKPAKSKPAKTLAILGRSKRTGRWRLAKRSNVLAVFGTVHLDMRKSFAEDDDKLKMNVTVLFGSATFILPFGAEVRPSGTSILAGSVVDVPEHDDPSELPTIDIEWTCVLGRLRIVTDTPVQTEVQDVVVVAATPEPEVLAPATPNIAPDAVEAVAATAQAEPAAAVAQAPDPDPVATEPAAQPEPTAEPAATEPEPAATEPTAEPVATEGAAEPEPSPVAEDPGPETGDDETELNRRAEDQADAEPAPAAEPQTEPV